MCRYGPFFPKKSGNVFFKLDDTLLQVKNQKISMTNRHADGGYLIKNSGQTDADGGYFIGPSLVGSNK